MNSAADHTTSSLSSDLVLDEVCRYTWQPKPSIIVAEGILTNTPHRVFDHLDKNDFSVLAVIADFKIDVSVLVHATLLGVPEVQLEGLVRSITISAQQYRSAMNN